MIALAFTGYVVARAALAYWEHKQMVMRSTALAVAIAALTAEVTDSVNKLASVKTFVEGVPGLVATAVADALAAYEAGNNDAAALVDAARETISDKVDAVFAAIDAEPAPVDPPAEEPAPVDPPEGEGEGEIDGA